MCVRCPESKASFRLGARNGRRAPGISGGMKAIAVTPEGRRVDVIDHAEPTLQRPTDVKVRILEVGRYRFDAAAFAWAARRIALVAEDPSRRWLVLDELGPLELKGAGLAPAVEILLAAPRHVTPVLVIRDGLVEPMLERFGLLPDDVRMFDWPRG